MPFVRISLKDNRSEKERQSIGDCERRRELVERCLPAAAGRDRGEHGQP
jgi:hypothetical protein